MARMQQTAVALDGAAVAAASAGRPAPQAVAQVLPDQRQGWLLVLGLAVVLCVIFGTTISALAALGYLLAPLLLVEAMGQRNFGSLLGIGSLIAGLGAAFGPAAVGYLVDATHTYTPALLLCAALAAAATLPIAMQQRPPVNPL